MNPTATLTVEPVGDRTIRIVRAFRAPRQVVYDAHTRPELLRRWLGPADWPMTECDIDLRAGGAFRHVMRGPGGEQMVMRGTYTDVEPPSRRRTGQGLHAILASPSSSRSVLRARVSRDLTVPIATPSENAISS